MRQVSIIMTVYNEKEEWLRQCLDSLLGQTYENIEIIIVLDNHQNQQLLQVLKAYEKEHQAIKLLINDSNPGRVNSLNLAFNESKGHYIAVMDADDIAVPERIAKSQLFLEQREYDVIFSEIDYIDENGNPFQPAGEARVIERDKVETMMKISNIASHPTLFARREVFERLNGYREINYCEDYDFFLRALENDFWLGKTDEVLLHYRVRSSGISKSYALEQFLNADFIRQKYIEGNLSKTPPAEVNQKFSKLNPKAKKNFLEAEGSYHKALQFKREKKMGLFFFNLFKSLANPYFLRKFKVIYRLNQEFKKL